MKLSDKIRILRKARGLSQEQLGYSLSRVNEDGISRQTVSDWENGKFEPKLENIRDLADVLNVSFDALLDESIDLEDDKVLYRVLNSENTKKQKESQIDNSFSYEIYPYKFSRRALVKILLIPISIAFLVIGIIVWVDFFKYSKADVLFWVFGTLGICALTLSVTLIVFLPSNIKELLHSKFTVRIGSLTNDYLHISTYKTASNSIFIPIEKIEKMELGEKANKRHGPVDITIKDRNKPLTLIDIKNPNKLIEVFNNLDSYIENPDEIKIL